MDRCLLQSGPLQLAPRQVAINILEGVEKGGLRLREQLNDQGRELQVQDVGDVYRGTEELSVVRHSLCHFRIRLISKLWTD